MIYKINKGFIADKVGDKTTIFDGETSTLFTFNKTGSIIFSKIKLGWEKEKIISFLVTNYLVKAEKAKKDVRDFIEMLLKNNIVKRQD